MNTTLTLTLVFVIFIMSVAVISGIYTFLMMSKEQKIKNIKEWLKYAVVMAEKQLGSGTGQLKLRYVYNTAVNKFPWIVTLITFEVFTLWVDEALEWMKDQLEKNAAINEFINK